LRPAVTTRAVGTTATIRPRGDATAQRRAGSPETDDAETPATMQYTANGSKVCVSKKRTKKRTAA